jgi:hypothetical protein
MNNLKKCKRMTLTKFIRKFNHNIKINLIFEKEKKTKLI